MLELLVVAAIVVSVTALAVPNLKTVQRNLRISGDARNLGGLISQAQLRAAAEYTHARVYANLSNNTYWLEVWNKSGNGGAGCWQTDGDSTNSCTVTGSSPVNTLSTGVSFGYGNVTSPPANTETTLGQAPLCYTGYAGQAGNTTTISNTACLEFNSRGVPSDPTANGKADANGALFITDGNSVYGITVLASSSIGNWYADNSSSASWQAR